MIDVWIRIIRVWPKRKIFIDVPILAKLSRWNLWLCVFRRSARRCLRRIMSWLCFKIHIGLCIENCLFARLGLCMERSSFLADWRLLRKCTTKVKDFFASLIKKRRRSSSRNMMGPATTKMESDTSLSRLNSKKVRTKEEVVVQWGWIGGKRQPAEQNNSGRKVAVHWWS